MSKEKLALLGGSPVLSDPLPSYNSIGEEEVRAVNDLMLAVAAGKATLSGFVGRGVPAFNGGLKVRELEKHFIQRFGRNQAVSFNSATTALQAAVGALGLGSGDEVITTPFTMCATSTAILLNGATPVFADIDPDTYCLSAKTIEACLTNRTKAVMVVDLFGGTADYDPILVLAEKRGLKIIEDNAQAPAATYKGRPAGTLGDIGIFSFNVAKVIQCGEGGMLITDSPEYAYRAQLIRNHGEAVVADWWNQSEAHHQLIAGNNFRLTEIQAAILMEQMKKLDDLNCRRIELADYLTEKLGMFSWLAPAFRLSNSKHVYYLYPFKFFSEKLGISRSIFAAAMKAEGFTLNEGYNIPAHLMPLYSQSGNPRYAKGICPVAERMFDRELLITTLCQPPKTKQHINLFVEALMKVEANVSELI